jgi:drug/metabolite transporter (DMT)-like permease
MLGFATTNLSFSRTALSFGHSVKSTEPVFLVALSYIFMRERISLTTIFSIVLIVIGVSLVALTELTFEWFSLQLIVIANLAFTIRALLTKRLQNTNVRVG